MQGLVDGRLLPSFSDVLTAQQKQRIARQRAWEKQSFPFVHAFFFPEAGVGILQRWKQSSCVDNAAIEEINDPKICRFPKVDSAAAMEAADDDDV